MNNRKRMIQRAYHKHRLFRHNTFLDEVRFAFGDEPCNKIRNATNAFRALRDALLRVPSLINYDEYRKFMYERINIKPKEAD